MLPGMLQPWEIPACSASLTKPPIPGKSDTFLCKNLPPSIPSTTRANLSLLASRMHHRSETYQSGDVILLATDALAMWLFKQLEQQTLPLEQILQLSQEEFVHLVNQQRLKKQMNDDDTTLL